MVFLSLQGNLTRCRPGSAEPMLHHLLVVPCQIRRQSNSSHHQRSRLLLFS